MGEQREAAILVLSTSISCGYTVWLTSPTSRHLVTVIYLLTLFWYTFGCRIRYSTPVYGDDTVVTTPAAPTFSEQVLKLIRAIFGSQPDGTLAGGGVFHALVFNAMLFIPLGFLLLLWFPKLRQSWRGAILAVLICQKVTYNLDQKNEEASKELDELMGGKVLKFKNEKLFDEQQFHDIETLMETEHMTPEQAMDALSVSSDKRLIYLKKKELVEA